MVINLDSIHGLNMKYLKKKYKNYKKITKKMIKKDLIQ